MKSNDAEAEKATDSGTEKEKDIVDHLSEATGYFHDSEAAKLRDIAAASGQKPVGVVKAAVEKEIERREWRCVHFEEKGREYISRNAYEYYKAHRSFELEYEAALEALPKEENSRLRMVQKHEHAAETLRDEKRRHRAKREQAEQWLKANGHELPEVDGDE